MVQVPPEPNLHWFWSTSRPGHRHPAFQVCICTLTIARKQEDSQFIYHDSQWSIMTYHEFMIYHDLSHLAQGGFLSWWKVAGGQLPKPGMSATGPAALFGMMSMDLHRTGKEKHIETPCETLEYHRISRMFFRALTSFQWGPWFAFQS